MNRIFQLLHYILSRLTLLLLLFYQFLILNFLGVLVVCYSLIIAESHKLHKQLSKITSRTPDKDVPSIDIGAMKDVDDDEEGGQTLNNLVGTVGSVRRTRKSLRLHSKLIRVSKSNKIQ